ncbi:MAG: MBL fold metallo-hydrolase [Candidatus Aminicenantes bacterium]|nr:MBL fold metallo-hydrolase [Candidatus Aminicenantes bacterium]
MDIHIINTGISSSYLIRDHGSVLIDAGVPGRIQKFEKRLKDLQIDPEDINAIIITHCHWDHVGCLKGLKELTGAKVMVHQNEKDLLEKGTLKIPPPVTRWGKTMHFLLKGMGRTMSTEPNKVDVIIGDEGLSLEEYGIPGDIIFTPGHSLGSISIVLDSGDAFVGDSAMNKFPLTIKPNLPIFAEDEAALKESWKKLIRKGAKIVYPGHGGPFSVEKVIEKAEL